MRYRIAFSVAAVLIGALVLYTYSMQRSVFGVLHVIAEQMPDDQRAVEFREALAAGYFPRVSDGTFSRELTHQIVFVDTMWHMFPAWAGGILAACLGVAKFWPEKLEPLSDWPEDR